jgi:hypothetical protein
LPAVSAAWYLCRPNLKREKPSDLPVQLATVLYGYGDRYRYGWRGRAGGIRPPDDESPKTYL